LFDISRAAKLDIPGRITELKPVKLLEEIAHIKKGMICVDLACGTGTLAIPMAELTGKNGKVYAVDRSPEMLEHLRHKSPPENIITVQRDVADTGLDNEIADFCLMAFIIHEVEKPESIILEAGRLLKPGGRIMVIEWREDRKSPGPSPQARVKRTFLKQLIEERGFSDSKFFDWSENYYTALAGKQAQI
jgi:ubiquinone/menaquinone biosynthesis C-methylase UbiE